MRSLRLEELLRYGLSGALFLVALLLRAPFAQTAPWVTTPGMGEVSEALALALLTGSLIYTFHRAVVFPWLLFPTALSLPALFGVYKFEKKFWIPFRVSDAEKQLDHDRYALRDQKAVLFDVWSEWAAQVHFLYCSGQAILFALAIGHILGGYNHRRLLLLLAISLLAAGLAHHVALICRAMTAWGKLTDERLSKLPPDTKPPTS